MKYLRELLIGVLVLLLAWTTIGAVRGARASHDASVARDSAAVMAKTADSLRILVESDEWHLQLTRAQAITARKDANTAKTALAKLLAETPVVVHLPNDTTSFVLKASFDALAAKAQAFMTKATLDQVAADRELAALRMVNVDLTNEVTALRGEIAQKDKEITALRKQIPGFWMTSRFVAIGVGIGIVAKVLLSH